MNDAMHVISVVSDKGQVTVPKVVRDRLGIEPGTRLAFKLDSDGGLRVSVLLKGSEGLDGLLARPGEPARSLADMEDAISAAVRHRGRSDR